MLAQPWHARLDPVPSAYKCVFSRFPPMQTAVSATGAPGMLLQRMGKVRVPPTWPRWYSSPGWVSPFTPHPRLSNSLIARSPPSTLLLYLSSNPPPNPPAPHPFPCHCLLFAHHRLVFFSCVLLVCFVPIFFLPFLLFGPFVLSLT